MASTDVTDDLVLGERKERIMKKHGRLLTAFGLLLAGVFVLAAPAFDQSVHDRIKSLEQELLQLKEQQIEMKKEATAAAQAMPSFSYRPGNGLNIEAADKSWGVRFTIETHFRYEFESGRDQIGRTNGEIMGVTASTTVYGECRQRSPLTVLEPVTARTQSTAPLAPY